MDQNKISAGLLKENCNWMTFKMNPPSASQAGRVWECQIRTICCVLSALLEKNETTLDGESFHTLICETKAIMNSHPLTVEYLSDPESPSPLMPNHILQLQFKHIWDIKKFKEESFVEDFSMLSTFLCRKIGQKICEQKTSSLPMERLKPASAWDATALNFLRKE